MQQFQILQMFIKIEYEKNDSPTSHLRLTWNYSNLGMKKPPRGRNRKLYKASISNTAESVVAHLAWAQNVR